MRGFLTKYTQIHPGNTASLAEGHNTAFKSITSACKLTSPVTLSKINHFFHLKPVSQGFED